MREYLGSVPVVKGFRVNKMAENHPIFNVMEKKYGLKREQLSFELIPREPHDFDELAIFRGAA